jgi:hypothetical protein
MKWYQDERPSTCCLIEAYCWLTGLVVLYMFHSKASWYPLNSQARLSVGYLKVALEQIISQLRGQDAVLGA